MRLSVSHKTRYSFDTAPAYGLQQIRLTPKTNAGQTVIDWQLDIDGGEVQVSYNDEHNNTVHLVALRDGAETITISSTGTLDMNDMGGVVGKQGGYAPLWLFKRQTPLTKAGTQIKALAKPLQGGTSDVTAFHDLSARILDHVTYKIGKTDAVTTAEDAIKLGTGVCQDHAHIFIAAARHAGVPARYVSGYLMMNDRVHQDATHAWAEVWIEGLGWTGFDVSNSISPDARYVRLATGLDYNQAAPISGLTYGGSGESIDVDVQVQQ